ncbi:MAG TPA: type II toxin-antitoxin system RelE/ParE family toxin [Dongiaceae bacterium]|nr:type II toxin-antitoxin system RelE/ParE family toxin [Dongiaceae bacterium]
MEGVLGKEGGLSWGHEASPSRSSRRREAGGRLSDQPCGKRLGAKRLEAVPTIGPGVREIRIKERSGAFRVIYQATLPDTVLVLDVFQKKTRKTPRPEIEKARNRLNAYLRDRGSK